MTTPAPRRAASPGAGSVGRQERRRARTRVKLLAAARTLVAERGPEGVTMTEVAAAADLGAGTVYNYFGSQQELLNAVVHDALDGFGDRLDALAAGLDDPAEIYSFSLRHLVEHASTDPLWARFVVQLGVTHPLLMEVLGPRATRDLRQGVLAGRFQITSLPLAVGVTFGSLLATLNLADEDLDDEGHRALASLFAAAMLRMAGLAPEEADQISRRPLPELTIPAGPADG